MLKPFHKLRDRLLRAGIAPRHVRRYLSELNDHVTDLRAEEEHAGRSPAAAEAAAFKRLGGMDDLANAMIGQRKFQSWSARVPWVMFSLAPILVLAAAWFVALFILWSGWNIFLPGAVTPFGAGHFRIFDSANIYFQMGRSIYFGAPILVGWGIALVAIRQRLTTIWPLVGIVLIALIGGTGQVHAHAPVAAGALAHINIGFTLAPGAQDSFWGLTHILVLLATTGLPYVVWRLQSTSSRSASSD